jgi:hypothetical protein
VARPAAARAGPSAFQRGVSGVVETSSALERAPGRGQYRPYYVLRLWAVGLRRGATCFGCGLGPEPFSPRHGVVARENEVWVSSPISKAY